MQNVSLYFCTFSFFYISWFEKIFFDSHVFKQFLAFSFFSIWAIQRKQYFVNLTYTGFRGLLDVTYCACCRIVLGLYSVASKQFWVLAELLFLYKWYKWIHDLLQNVKMMYINFLNSCCCYCSLLSMLFVITCHLHLSFYSSTCHFFFFENISFIFLY